MKCSITVYLNNGKMHTYADCTFTLEDTGTTPGLFITQGPIGHNIGYPWHTIEHYTWFKIEEPS